MLDSHASASLPRRHWHRASQTPLRDGLAWAAWFSGRLPLDVDVCSGAVATGAGDIMFSWERVTGPDGVKLDLYMRQLWDNQGSAVIEA